MRVIEMKRIRYQALRPHKCFLIKFGLITKTLILIIDRKGLTSVHNTVLSGVPCSQNI